MKVGPRNAMVIAVVSLTLVADRERGELRASFGSAGPVPGLVTAPWATASFPERGRRRRQPHRRRPRRPPTAGTRSACSPPARSNGASHEDRADGQRRAGRGRRLGRRASSSPSVSGWDCLARRTRASRGSAARARCCSTARSCAPASSSRRRRTATSSRLRASRRRACTACRRRSSRPAPSSAASAPGLVVATVDLLAHTPQPTDDEIREALSGNLCRCTGYSKIFDAVRLAASS